ncbi:hypothetical protein L873DRAFT_618765 [Choiromyces venosus 120613-1]|uniref:Uncharacterized protein n=1 Tax=Choiromyces venosus 120613-1 TaxID=1336337 RepID=A0A3N4IZK6_9PEZI|nr:hypothetical protein L873DRAFT_618765 [Choiromyces venosus 120613-1]
MAEATYTRSVTMGDNNAHCNNTIGSFNNTLNQTFNLSDKDAQIMQWISPLDPQYRHQGVCNDRFDGVGD